MGKYILIALALVCQLAIPVLPVLGDSAAASSPTQMQAGYDGDVIIGQEVVLRIRFPGGGLSVKERTDIVTQRINDLLGSRPFDPSEVAVVVRNKEHVVLIGGNVIVTADKQTAEYNKTTPEQLANMWAANLRRVIPKAKAEPIQDKGTEQEGSSASETT